MAENKPNTAFADKLSGLKLDYEAYGQLPSRNDVLVLDVPEGKDPDALVKKLDQLLYIGSHLRKINDYIESGTKEPINEWDGRTVAGLSTKVLSDLKGHNNETGGISAYFYNLQNKYDEYEAVFDEMEAACIVPEDIRELIPRLRAGRGDKRKTRRELRKVMVKGLKKDDKGYLYIETEEPPVETKTETKGTDASPETEPKKDASDKKEGIEGVALKKKISSKTVTVAGIAILLTVVIAVAVTSKNET